MEIFGRNPLEIIPPKPDPSFDVWMALLPDEEKPPEGQRGPLDEPAGDGVNNLLKYALGLKPLIPYAHEGPRLAYFSGDILALEVIESGLE